MASRLACQPRQGPVHLPLQQHRSCIPRTAWRLPPAAAQQTGQAVSPAGPMQLDQRERLQQGASPPAPSTLSDTYEFTYQGNDGRLKATFEQAFKNVGRQNCGAGSTTTAGAPADAPAAPWALSYQMSEKYMLWSYDLKARLLKRVAADELGIGDEELEARLARVCMLLPDIQSKLASMRAKVVARLAAHVERLPERLLHLKAIFPGANASVLAMRQPELVLGADLEKIDAVARELRALFPALNIDLLVEANPAMLDVPGLKKALAEAKRVMPGLDVQQAMASNPQLIFSFQTGNQLIPYDQFEPTKALGGADDDEYAAYYD